MSDKSLLEMKVIYHPKQVMHADDLKPGRFYKEIEVDDYGNHISKSEFLVLAIQNLDGSRKVVINKTVDSEDVVKEIDLADFVSIPYADNNQDNQHYLVPAESWKEEIEDPENAYLKVVHLNGNAEPEGMYTYGPFEKEKVGLIKPLVTYLHRKIKRNGTFIQVSILDYLPANGAPIAPKKFLSTLRVDGSGLEKLLVRAKESF